MADHHPKGMSHHDHPGFDPERLMAMEERRRAMLPPEEILDRFLARDDATMLDIGCGAGFFTIPAAKRLDRGRVLAADLQQNMVDTTLRRAKEEGVTNVEGVTAPASSLPIAEKSVDIALLSMVLHDIDEQGAALSELRRVLKPGGTLFLIEMDKNEEGFGPPMEIRLSPVELTGMLTRAGFAGLEIADSPQQEGIYFIKATSPR